MKTLKDYKITFPYKATDGLLVDDDDRHYLNTKGKWVEVGKVGYAQVCWKNNGKRYREYLHRIIVGAKKGEIVDHVNRNKLDNRRANLRITTHRENRLNAKVYSSSTSLVNGVHWYKARSKWMVQVPNYGKKIFMGYFDDLDDATQCAYATRMQLNNTIGEFAK